MTQPLPTVEQVAADHAVQTGLARAMAFNAAMQIWRSAPLGGLPELLGWWFAQGRDRLLVTLGIAQEMVAAQAPRYVEDAMGVQGWAVELPQLVPERFAATASDGRSLESLLDRVAFQVAVAVRQDDKRLEDAVREAEPLLQRIVHTQVTDATREADGVVLATSRTDGPVASDWQPSVARRPVTDREFLDANEIVDPWARRRREQDLAAAKRANRSPIGWVRMLSPPSCGRCAVLAGRWYGWNEGFQRHPNCFPAGVVVSGPAVDATTRRWYEGELVVIRTAGGKKLPATANHPVLTDHGWVPAKLLVPGDHVVGGSSAQATPLRGPDHQQVPARIEDLWDAASVVGLLRQVPMTPEDFHGDGGYAQVDVVAPDGLLRDWAQIAQPLSQSRLASRAGLADGLSVQRSLDEAFLAAGTPTRSGVRGGSLTPAALCGHLASPNQASLRAPSDRDVSPYQTVAHDAATHAERRGQRQFTLASQIALSEQIDGQLQVPPRWDAPSGPFTMESGGAYASRGKDLYLRLASQVELDRVIEVERVQWSGHVYNLTSSEGWFSANGIIASNCDCRHIPAIESDAGDLTTDPQLYFDSLTPAEQDELFGTAAAEAIRNGADITQVINAQNRQGGSYTVDGRQYTREGTTRKGYYGGTEAGRKRQRRPTPVQIYNDAKGDRQRAVTLLTEFGYIVA